ncbi:MAG: DUF805 domain-containing protein [Candidatus Moranbacteria bacterium]|nr:DUF805 domain-containing protein [Candidatus Moranbacteria bacterium]
MNYYIEVLKKYAVFNGRATRSEYWFFMLFNNLIIFLFPTLVLMFAMVFISSAEIFEGLSVGVFIIISIYWFATIIPTIAVTVRRLHDIGKSGAWFFISFIPFGIGFVWLLILMVTDSQSGENEYGANPKKMSA